MKYVEEYRDPDAARQYVAAIHRIATRPWTIMEICGGQTHSIVKYGIDELLPKQITLAHARAVQSASRRLS
jgi:hydrogenase expression/formation protein HypD